MNDFVSLRYLLSLIGSESGIASLDASGKIDASLLPGGTALGAFSGSFDTVASVEAEYTTGGTSGQYAIIDGVKHYWNAAMTPPAWTSVEITISAYNALTDEEKNGQSEWLIVPDPAV